MKNFESILGFIGGMLGLIAGAVFTQYFISFEVWVTCPPHVPFLIAGIVVMIFSIIGIFGAIYTTNKDNRKGHSAMLIASLGVLLPVFYFLFSIAWGLYITEVAFLILGFLGGFSLLAAGLVGPLKR